jgi:nucleoid-associated protein YgaU
MYIIPIAWLYVALMMSVAEATNTTGTVLGAIVTFVLYGALPIALMLYFMGTPARKRKLRARETAEREAAIAAHAAAAATAAGPAAAANPGAAAESPTESIQPDTSSEAPADPVSPVGKEA